MALADLQTSSAVNAIAMLANADMVWGAFTARAIYSEPGQQIFDGAAIAEHPEVIFLTADFPGISRGASITVNGTAYTTRAPVTVDDGALSHMEIVPA